MDEVGVHETKTRLSELLRRVAAGEEITITRGGEPVARLVPVDAPTAREFGRDEGLFEVPDDFDSPLPQSVVAAFEA